MRLSETDVQKRLIAPLTAGMMLLGGLPTVLASEPKLEQNFGHQAVSGDFNNDGYDDLAIGNPAAKHTDAEGKIVECGSVEIYYGSAKGLNDVANEAWVQDGSVFPHGKIEKGDQFGYALAAGDLNGDGYDDLAIGTPGEDITIGDSNRKDSGVVNVLYGSSIGLDTFNAQTWYQSQMALPGKSEKDDGFGMAMTIGDYDNDGYGDLAIGVPWEDVGNIKDMGVVVVLRGSVYGLSAEKASEWHKNKYSASSIGRSGEMFGFSLVSADFNADGIDDLAVGVPYDTVTSSYSNDPEKYKEKGKKKLLETGAVNVFYGSSAKGLRIDNDQWWHQNKMGVEALAEKDDLFGWSLAAGDFDGDQVYDLAIGIPGESLKGERNVKQTGAVEIMYGQPGIGLSSDNDQFWHQASGIQSVVEHKDYFGVSLASGDFDNDGIDDLAIGVPGEDLGKIKDAGLVNVLYGEYREGLTDVGQVWHQNKSGVKGSADSKDQFGSALAVGNFNGDNACDLAIGSPSDEDTSSEGSVNVLYGEASFGLSAVLDQLLADTP